MVPLHLRLYNFLSYQGETVLDLRGIHVGCLSGDNGNGKSALLDAVTWALWGFARGRRYGQGGRPADELVHQGQADMEVALTFDVDGAEYRAIRKYSKGARRRSAASLLDLQARTGDGFSSLAAGGVNDTEQRIKDLLRMTYETFVSSAFLLQGQSDRFATSKPAERKETLAEILGLELYERLQERARARVREHDGLLARNAVERETAERELAARPDVEARLASAQQELADVSPRLELARAREAALDAQAAALEHVQREAQALGDAAATARAQADSLEQQAATALDRVARCQEVLGQRAEIESGAARRTDAHARVQRLDADRQRHGELLSQAQALQHAVAQAEGALESARARLADRVERELAPRAARGVDAAAALAALAVDEAAIALERESAAAQRAELERHALAAGRLQHDNDRLRVEMEELRGGLDMLGADATHCPLCNTPLGADGLAHLREERNRQGVAAREQYRTNEAELADLTQRRQRLQSAAETAESSVQGRQTALTQRGAELRLAVTDGLAADAELAEQRPQLDALTRQLAERRFAEGEQAGLADAEAALAALSYDADAHADAQGGLAALEQFAELARDLRDAEERLPEAQAQEQELAKLAHDRRGEAESADRRLAEIAGQLEGAPALRADQQAQATERAAMDARAAALSGDVRHHTLQLEGLAERAGQMAALSARHAELQAARAAYAVLVDAFGKGGIQALLIEAALPELESQANDLLARLTDHRMALTLETQRQSRQGAVAETLEIRIADELGTRDYELYSGGEAFRIDFALRVALAKLLASRSGAPLRTLFLDEGFGTQDPEGRERLVEAIRTIQDEFDLILVVTHIEELKEAFPVRIDVTKGDTGSALEVVWV